MTLWFDGARYFDHCKYAFILRINGVDYKESGISQSSTSVGVEYDALIRGLKKAIDLRARELTIIGDSKTVLHQITGQQRARKTNDKLQEAIRLLELLPSYTIEWIPSAENPAHSLF